MEWKAAGGQGARAGEKASEGLGEGKDKQQQVAGGHIGDEKAVVG